VNIGGLSPEMDGKWPGRPLEDRESVIEARRVREIKPDIGGLRWIKED
jgi:hypothetical protein